MHRYWQINPASTLVYLTSTLVYERLRGQACEELGAFEYGVAKSRMCPAVRQFGSATNAGHPGWSACVLGPRPQADAGAVRPLPSQKEANHTPRNPTRARRLPEGRMQAVVGPRGRVVSRGALPIWGLCAVRHQSGGTPTPTVDRVEGSKALVTAYCARLVSPKT